MEANKVVQALKVLQEAGREDLTKEGVLEQAWVGLKRPKRSSADRVSAAVLACKSPESSPKKCKKFRAKSFAGRKVSVSPEREREEVEELYIEGLPGVSSVRGVERVFPEDLELRCSSSWRQPVEGPFLCRLRVGRARRWSAALERAHSARRGGRRLQ
ncbi:hypothetical protein NDU88_000014 [Pleurodeles waltl]|uniref:Uncharacterized protein n=1 Tax=Pleurodeles waltl TaxID=8319 RepID=A0AAV7UPJ6_PLEWA|nr:hypothetical protein NDU88_000014 [Pleurodeles waltl]